jgi:hypothetical protein
MPALPPVPATFRVDLHHKLANDMNVVSRLFFNYTGPAPTNAQMNTLATAVRTAWNSNVGILAGAQVNVHQVECIDLSSATGAIGFDSTTVTGTRAGTTLAAGTAVLINYAVARRYRGGKPRSYLPYLMAADLTDAQDWTAAAVTATNSAWGAFITAIKAAPWSGATITNQVNVSYYQGFASVQNPVTLRWKNLSKPRAVPLVDVITSFSTNAKPASQRRRNLHST